MSFSIVNGTVYQFKLHCFSCFGYHNKNYKFALQNETKIAKNTSILLGDYFDKFIGQQIATGRFSSASEVVRTALRFFEAEENKKEELINKLKKGEKSKFIQNFDRKEFIKNLHNKHVTDTI